MTRPIRPAPVVAAAVLLIVMGSEYLLGAIAGMVLHRVAGVDFWSDFGLVFAVILLVVGVHFLSTGIGVLNGTLAEPTRASKLVLTFGLFLSALSLPTLCCSAWFLFTTDEFNVAKLGGNDLRIFAVLVGLWANSAGVMTAGVLLYNNVERYLHWRKATRRHPTEDGYEPEVEA